MIYSSEKDIQTFIRDNWDYSEGQFIRKSNGKLVGTLLNSGYISTSIKISGVVNRVLIHKLVYLYYHGYIPDVLDHIDRDKSNNRVENLRPANKSLNEANTGPRPKNKSGYKGVCWHKAAKKWRVTLKEKHYGLYTELRDAVNKYNSLAKEFYGEYSYSQDYKDT